MALGNATIVGQQGQTTMRPNGILRMTFAGDGVYPTGGTADFVDTYLKAQLGREIAVTQVVGYGFTAGAITHIAQYDVTNDKLLVYVLAGTQATNNANLSAVTFDVEVHYR